MATPITWRTVNGDSGSAAASLLGQAGNSLNNAFTGFGKAVDSVVAGREAERQKLIKTNTDKFLNTLAQYTRPEQLQAAQEAGQLNTILSGFGDNIDMSQVRNAVPTALANLQKQALASQAYDVAQRDYGEAGTVDDFMSQIVSADTPEALDGILGKLNAPEMNLRQESPLFKAVEGRRKELTQGERDAFNFGRTKLEAGREDEKYAADKLYQQLAGQQTDFINQQGLDRGQQLASQLDHFGFTEDELSGGLPLDKQSQMVLSDILKKNAPITEGNLTKKYENELRKNNPNLPEDYVQKLKQDFQTRLTQRNALLPGDAAELESARKSLKRKYAIEKNPLFVPQDYSPVDEAAKILEENEKFSELGGGDAEDTYNTLVKAMVEGITVKSGEDERVMKVPPGVIRLALGNVTDNFRGGEAQLTESALADLISKLNLDKYEKELNAYNDESIELEASAITRYNGDDPVRYVNRNLRVLERLANQK